jgi:hypothetical protein
MTGVEDCVNYFKEKSPVNEIEILLPKYAA